MCAAVWVPTVRGGAGKGLLYFILYFNSHLQVTPFTVSSGVEKSGDHEFIFGLGQKQYL